MNHYGQAKNEICSKIPEIKAFLNKGLTRGQAFQALKEQGKIAFSRAQFYRVVSKYININEQSPKLAFDSNRASESESAQVDIEDYIRENPKEEKTVISEEDVADSSDLPKTSKFKPKNPNPIFPPKFDYNPQEIADDSEKVMDRLW